MSEFNPSDADEDQTGKCYCKKIKFQIKNIKQPRFNVFCHCKLCSRARGTSPIHLVGINEMNFKIIKGQEYLKTINTNPEDVTSSYKEPRPMTHTFCSGK